jgi:putative hydrolase of the HAD superfamily
MAITIPGRVIVFDYGEVISIMPTEADRAQLTKLAGVDGPVFWDAYWRHRDALDQGTKTVKEYWQSIGDDLGMSWNTAQMHRLWLIDFRGWLAIDPGVLDVLIDLQEGGTRMALLSNAGPDFASYYRHGMIGDFFEQVFTSGELGTLKPGPEIYAALISGLAVRPDEVVFVDNKEENVHGAQALGITGHVFTTAANLRAYLENVAQEAAAAGAVSL